MKEENKDKRLLQVELDNNVKKVSITGLDADEKVILKQELNEDELDQIAGGKLVFSFCKTLCPKKKKTK